MAASKSTTVLQTSATNTAGSTAGPSSALDLTAKDFCTVTGIVTNAGTGPTIACSFIIQTSMDNSTYRDAFTFVAGTTASTTYTFYQDIGPGVLYIKSKFTGNTAQSVTVMAEAGYGTF